MTDIDFDDIGAKRCITPDDVNQIVLSTIYLNYFFEMSNVRSQIIRVTNVSDPVCSPDGRYIAFVRTKLVEKDLSKSSSICVVKTQPNDEGTFQVRRLTTGPGDSSPCWSGDSRSIAFLRNSQAFVVSNHSSLKICHVTLVQHFSMVFRSV